MHAAASGSTVHATSASPCHVSATSVSTSARGLGCAGARADVSASWRSRSRSSRPTGLTAPESSSLRNLSSRACSMLCTGPCSARDRRPLCSHCCVWMRARFHFSWAVVVASSAVMLRMRAPIIDTVAMMRPKTGTTKRLTEGIAPELGSPRSPRAAARLVRTAPITRMRSTASHTSEGRCGGHRTSQILPTASTTTSTTSAASTVVVPFAGW